MNWFGNLVTNSKNFKSERKNRPERLDGDKEGISELVTFATQQFPIALSHTNKYNKESNSISAAALFSSFLFPSLSSSFNLLTLSWDSINL